MSITDFIEDAKKHTEKTFDRCIDDWVNEAMYDHKIDKESYDPEVLKKVMKFGYYTALHEFNDRLLIGDE